MIQVFEGVCVCMCVCVCVIMPPGYYYIMHLDQGVSSGNLGRNTEGQTCKFRSCQLQQNILETTLSMQIVTYVLIFFI